MRGYEQPGAWLLWVATNLALNELRRRSAPIAAAEPFADDDAPGALASSDPNLRLAERDLVEQTLLELTPQQRAALARTISYQPSQARGRGSTPLSLTSFLALGARLPPVGGW